MAMDDRGTHLSVDEEREGSAVARRLHGGAHRKGRAGAETGEPLFTRPAPDPFVDLVDLIDLTAPTREPARDLVDWGPAPSPGPIETEAPTGRLRSFRRWWRQESLARAAQKRAFAAAEAVIRAQAMQEADQPFEKGPTPESYAQALRSVMALTEERFQSLGLRSDRLQDELAGIWRKLGELNALLTQGLEQLKASIPQEMALVRAEIPREIQRIRSVIPEEMERLRAQHRKELDHLRDVSLEELDRIRSAVPEGFAQVRAAIPEEMEKVRAALPDEIDRVIGAMAEGFDRILAQMPEELEKVRLTIPVEIERLKASIPEALERARRAAEHIDPATPEAG